MFEKDSWIWHNGTLFGCQKVKYICSMGDGFSAVELSLAHGGVRHVRVEDSTLTETAWVSPLVTFTGSWS